MRASSLIFIFIWSWAAARRRRSAAGTPRVPPLFTCFYLEEGNTRARPPRHKHVGTHISFPRARVGLTRRRRGGQPAKGCGRAQLGDVEVLGRSAVGRRAGNS